MPNPTLEHGGGVVSTVALHHGGPGFESTICLKFFFVECACSPRGFQGTLASSHITNTVLLGVSVNGFLSVCWPCNRLATCPGVPLPRALC